MSVNAISSSELSQNFFKVNTPGSATANKAATVIQKHVRGQLTRKPFLSSNFRYREYQALCERAEGLEFYSMPQAPGGKTRVYLPKEMPEVVLKFSGKDSAIKRFHQMREVRAFLSSQNSSHLIVPRAKPCGQFLVEQRLPISTDDDQSIELYLSEPKIFDEAVREFVRLFSKKYIHCLTTLLEKECIRYDNIPFYAIERNGKKEGCIGLVDLERFKNDPVSYCLDTLLRIFPLHLDLIKEEAKLLKMKINEQSLEASQKSGREGLAEQGGDSWGKRRYSSYDSKLWKRMLFVDLILKGNPSQRDIKKILSSASDLRDEDLAYAIYIYKQVIAYDPYQFEAYTALCFLLEDPVERLELFSKAADYAREKGKHKLAMNFLRHAENSNYQECISQADLANPLEAENLAYPASMSEEDWETPVAFLKKLPPMPQALVDFLEGPCPIYEGKKAKDTHFVAPLTKNFTRIVDGNLVTMPRTVESLHKLSRSVGGPECVNHWTLKDRDRKPSEIDFEWGVMTKDLFPDSKGKSYEMQKQLVEEKGYQMPSVLEAATCMLWENRRSGIYFYNDIYTYTRCYDELDEGLHPAVGGFHKGSGLYVYSGYDSYDVGVAGIRKFPVSKPDRIDP